jgi:hypothetical protein
MTDKFTPGPWYSLPWAFVTDPRELEAEGENSYFAVADVRLMTAAPDLLAACEALLACMGPGHSITEVFRAVDLARAAIARARGVA